MYVHVCSRRFTAHCNTTCAYIRRYTTNATEVVAHGSPWRCFAGGMVARVVLTPLLHDSAVTISGLRNNPT